MARHEAYWKKSIASLRERLGEGVNWYPYPALVAFGLVVVLSGHSLLSINPRLGHHADVMEYAAETQPEGAIWLSLTPIDDQLVVSTTERQVIRMPLQMRKLDDAAPLIEYLRERVRKESISAGLAMEATAIQTTAILAVDEHLAYSHLRPVIDALAAVGITNYGFETRNLNVGAAIKDDSHNDDKHHKAM